MKRPSRLVFVFGLSLTARAQVSPIQLELDRGLQAQPTFHYRSEPTSDSVVLGSSISFQVDGRGGVVARRILCDPSRHYYYGYEVLLAPQAQTDRYLINFQDLNVTASGLSMTGWMLQSPATLPAPKIMRAGETISVDLGTNEVGGRIADLILITQLQPSTQVDMTRVTDWARIMAYRSLIRQELGRRSLQPGEPTPPNPAIASQRPYGRIPTITGTPRPFTPGDAELRLVEPSLKVNGSLVSPAGSLKTASGRLIYLHLPGKGRYVLSLADRPELGFTRAGEASGGSLRWAVDDDTFSVESSAVIAPGGGPFFIYVLHESNWQSAAAAERGRVLTGSVAPEEIQIFRKESSK
jgi:hypothetical protein